MWQLEQTLLSTGLPEDAMQALLAVHVTFNAGLGRCTLRAKWLGIDVLGDSWKGVTFPPVPYLQLDAVSKYRGWKNQVLEDIVKNAGHPLGDGIYLTRASLRNDIETRLAHLREQILRDSELKFGDIGALKLDFESRLSEVLHEFAKEKNLVLKQGDGIRDALAQFDKYMSDKPFELSYSLFVPVLGGQDARLKYAVQKLSSQAYQVPIFTQYPSFQSGIQSSD